MKAPTSARTLRTACIATLLAMIVLLGGFASASAYAATVQGNVFSSSEGQGIPYAEVEIWRQDAGTWGVEDLATCDADGAWSYDTTDTSPVRVRAYDPTAGHKPAWFGGTSVQSATDVIPSDTPDDTNMTLPFVKGGTLGGWAGDSNSGYPIDKIRVTAWLVGVTNPVVHQTTTADDGVFSLPNLPAGSYIVRFDDPTLTWDTQYAFFADVQADATPFEIDGPGSYFCDGFLSRHVSALTLTPTAASSDSTLSPAVGGTITLETTCTDANLGGALRSGMPVQLYASPDGAAWTPQANPVTSPSVGRYRTSIAITSVGKIYYKFAVPAADYRAYVESDPCLVIRRGPTYWSTDLSVVPGQPTNPGPGDATAITAKLVTGDGAPAAGRVVRVQASPWNGWWWDAGVVARDMGGGVYRADLTPARSLSYRFVTVGTRAEPAVTSSELFVPCAGVYNLWTDYGAGPHFIVNWYENYGHSSTASAYSTQISTTDTPTVYVLTSPDGVNFTRANLPIVRSVITAPGGHPAVKYTAQIPSVTALRFYSFVMASNGTTGVCEPTFVGPNAWLGAITAKATVSASRAFTVSGSIKPHIAAGYKTVTLRCVRSGSSKTKFFTAMVYDSGAFSVYRASIKLPRGTWRIYPHVASGSKYGGVVGGWANAWGDSQQLIFKKVVVR